MERKDLDKSEDQQSEQESREKREHRESGTDRAEVVGGQSQQHTHKREQLEHRREAKTHNERRGAVQELELGNHESPKREVEKPGEEGQRTNHVVGCALVAFHLISEERVGLV